MKIKTTAFVFLCFFPFLGSFGKIGWSKAEFEKNFGVGETVSKEEVFEEVKYQIPFRGNTLYITTVFSDGKSIYVFYRYIEKFSDDEFRKIIEGNNLTFKSISPDFYEVEKENENYKIRYFNGLLGMSVIIYNEGEYKKFKTLEEKKRINEEKSAEKKATEAERQRNKELDKLF